MFCLCIFYVLHLVDYYTHLQVDDLEAGMKLANQKIDQILVKRTRTTVKVLNGLLYSQY